MPGFDRTGPEGEGPMTGRRMGRCNPVSHNKRDENISDNLPGRGMAMRRDRARRGDRASARGRGFGRRK